MNLMPIGRPTIRTDAMIRELLDRLAEGESLRSICSDTHMPARQTIMVWVGEDVNFSNQYARAREDGLDNRADKIEQDLNDEPDVARARLKLDFAKWYLSKLAPKRYGDKIQQELSGPGGGPVRTLDVRGLTAEQIEALAAVGIGEE